MTVRYLIRCSYDGTKFHGWAKQDQQRTVQDVVQTWLYRLTGTHVSVRVAGRTDAGVHARGQVCHVDFPQEIDHRDLFYRLQKVLPPDLIVTELSPAPPHFDARFGALFRRYCYRLADFAFDPILRYSITRIRRSVNVELLNQALGRTLGLANFAPFCRAKPGASTIRTLQEARAHRVTTGYAVNTIEIWLQADAFCHSMVRSLTGATVAVATGQRSLNWLEAVLESPKRRTDIQVLPAHGLTLEEVGYPSTEQLRSHADQTRRHRSIHDLTRSDPPIGTLDRISDHS